MASSRVNIVEKTDEEIFALAKPLWRDLVKYLVRPQFGCEGRIVRDRLRQQAAAGGSRIGLGSALGRVDYWDTAWAGDLEQSGDGVAGGPAHLAAG